MVDLLGESMVILKDELSGLLISAYRISLDWWYGNDEVEAMRLRG
jgi:hypothetical protein